MDNNRENEKDDIKERIKAWKSAYNANLDGCRYCVCNNPWEEDEARKEGENILKLIEAYREKYKCDDFEKEEERLQHANYTGKDEGPEDYENENDNDED